MKHVLANQTLDRCDSTNDLARVLGEEGYPHGTWISTRIQEKGRGRLGRKWESQEGNLFLSIVLRIEDKSVWTWIPMTIAIAITEAVGKAFPQHRIPMRVKWPNDLWIDGKKTGGILCEAVGNKTGSFIVAGIGLNCAYAPEGLDQETTSLSAQTGTAVTADQVRDFIHEEILSSLGALQKEGKKWVMGRYSKIAALPTGSEIEWGEKGSGTVLGLGELGELLVKESSGTETRLYAEDVTRKVRRKK
jgi:BirA family biotin operon repressor/biotin-[acetyl-CoA-carboxylase] ligase